MSRPDTPHIAHRIARQGNRGDAWDVAHAALFLASDEACYSTGTELLVDGGFVSKTV